MARDETEHKFICNVSHRLKKPTHSLDVMFNILQNVQKLNPQAPARPCDELLTHSGMYPAFSTLLPIPKTFTSQEKEKKKKF